MSNAASPSASIRIGLCGAPSSRRASCASRSIGVAAIKRSDIVRMLDRIEDENGATIATRTLAYVGRIMNWHAARDDDFKSPIVRGMARRKPSDHARSRVLNDDELLAVSGGRSHVAAGVAQAISQSAAVIQQGGSVSIGGGNGATSFSGNLTVVETFVAAITQVATNVNTGNVNVTVAV